MIGPRPTRTMIPFISGGGFSYPTIASSLLWINRFESCTDTSGAVPAVAGDPVRTIKLRSGWGASLGDGLVRQDTLGNRPTYQTNGLQGNGTSTIMALPATISVSGVFTAYFVYEFTSGFLPTFGLVGNSATLGGVLGDVDAAPKLRCYDNTASFIFERPFASGTLLMFRQRRKADNSIWQALTGIADASTGTNAYTWPLASLFKRFDGTNTATSVRIRQIVLVGADTVTAGTDPTIQSALIALESGLTGIS